MAFNTIYAKSIIFSFLVPSENTLQHKFASYWGWNSCTFGCSKRFCIHFFRQTTLKDWLHVCRVSWCFHSGRNFLFYNNWSSVETAQTDRWGLLFSPASDSLLPSDNNRTDNVSLWLTSTTFHSFLIYLTTNAEVMCSVWTHTVINKPNKPRESIFSISTERKLNTFTCCLISVC